MFKAQRKEKISIGLASAGKRAFLQTKVQCYPRKVNEKLCIVIVQKKTGLEDGEK